MSSSAVLKDTFWQIFWRVVSAIAGFVVIKIMTLSLGPLRYWDYTTILKFFAIWSALADFWLYVIALKTLSEKKKQMEEWILSMKDLEIYYSKFVTSRLTTIFFVYWIAILIAYLIPEYTANPYISSGLIFGMIFSALFMASWIIQLPQQLYGKMHQVSIALILARIAQIWSLFATYYLFYQDSFVSWDIPVFYFLLVLSSLVVSWAAQWLYTYFSWRNLIRLRWVFDWKFTVNQLFSQWRYWLAYYLSSFHTLIVLILLSIFFPTILWYKFWGIRSLALSLMEILLIIPSALWNSILHRAESMTDIWKRKSFWNVIVLIGRIALVVMSNFILFAKEIILLISWPEFLTSSSWLGSDFVLPFLWFVLILSFIKQIFNYFFVSNWIHNKLFNINLFWVIIWTSIGLYLVKEFNIFGWIVTQILLEVLFVWWAIYTAVVNKVAPYFYFHKVLYLLLYMSIPFWVVLYLQLNWISFLSNVWADFIVKWALFNMFVVYLSFKDVKSISKNMVNIDDGIESMVN